MGQEQAHTNGMHSKARSMAKVVHNTQWGSVGNAMPCEHVCKTMKAWPMKNQKCYRTDGEKGRSRGRRARVILVHGKEIEHGEARQPAAGHAQRSAYARL